MNSTYRIAVLCVLMLVFIVPSIAHAAGCDGAASPLIVTLPYTQNFDTDAWTSINCEECSGTSTHVTSGCYDGGCMKVTPPTSTCTSGNGGAVGIGWIQYSAVPVFHVRFLIKFGSSFVANKDTSITKFLLQDGPDRTGILGLLKVPTGEYMCFGITDMATGQYWYDNTAPGYIEDCDAVRRISSSNLTGWIAVEYVIDNPNNQTSLYMWTQDGSLNGLQYTISSTISSDNEAFYISYWNGMGTADANNYYLLDNMVVSGSYIGPPDGFTGGSTRKLNNVTGVRVTLH